ncbi:MAG: hypothetical protein HOV97_05875 [Nonomuraea sp.]|nr:hypothetical protein [Nonomuraea sp.]
MSDAPAKSPCGSCPYRRDAPTGLWHHDHYAKLVEYDNDNMADQPELVFACHQQDGRLCAGWVAVHDMEKNLALFLALLQGWITPDVFATCLTYATSVPLFASGREACDHGMRDYEDPPERTRRVVNKLMKTKDVTLG